MTAGSPALTYDPEKKCIIAALAPASEKNSPRKTGALTPFVNQRPGLCLPGRKEPVPGLGVGSAP